MGKLVDYECTPTMYRGVTPEYAQRLGLEVPELYRHAEDLAKVVVAQREESGASYCRLPFDTVLLAENIGGTAIYDQSPLGPRKERDLFDDITDVANLPAVDPGHGRMGEVLRACSILKEQGEIPVIDVRGFFDTMNGLVDLAKLMQPFLRKPETLQPVADKLRADMVSFALAAEAAGCPLIEYVDGSAGVNVLGPKVVTRLVEMFTYPLMKDLDSSLAAQTVIQLCPKTSFSLVGTDLARWVSIPAQGGRSYLEEYLANEQIRFTGTKCNRDLSDIAVDKVAYLELL